MARGGGCTSTQLQRRPNPEATDCSEGCGSFQGADPGDHAKSQGGQHQYHSGRTGPLHEGLARLLRLLRNPRSAGATYSLGPDAASVRSVATVANWSSS